MKRFVLTVAVAFSGFALAPTIALAGVNPSGTPAIEGDAQVGATLTCDPSQITWSSTDGGTPTAVDFDFYDWDNGSLGAEISDTNSGADNTYVVQSSDVGQQIVCTETEQDGDGLTNGDGSQDATEPSNPTATIPAPPTAAGTTIGHRGSRGRPTAYVRRQPG